MQGASARAASGPREEAQVAFKGFPEFRSNVLYCPKQFFSVVVPHSSVNCIRVVSYMLRKTLGWVDETGEPVTERHEFSYRELEQVAGVSHSRLGEAIEDALKANFIRRVSKARIQVQGVRAKSASYELCWDENHYTDDPKEFRGFFLQPTYIDRAGQTRLGRKNIPNIFFDYLVRHENRGLIRVVGSLLWYSIDWGKGGERRRPVQKSLRDLVELTQLDKSSVVRALDEAERKGYVERIERGVFDLSGKKESSTTVYGIHWTSSYTYTYEGLAVEVADERSQNATQLAMANAPKMQHDSATRTLPKRNTEQREEHSQNATHDAPKMQHGERSQNATRRITNRSIPNTPIPNNSSSSPFPAPSVDAAKSLLLEVGFGRAAADELARSNPAEVIKRQIALLPARNPSKNRLGLLRRAIEEDWPAPTTDVGSSGPDTVFAANFYAGYNGNPEAPVSEPSASDVQAARGFVKRLLEIDPSEPSVPEWGREFGELVRHHHRKKGQVMPALRLALQRHGDEYFGWFQEVRRAEKERKAQQARDEHFRRFESSYRRYVAEQFSLHQDSNSELFQAFRAEEEQSLASLRNNRFGLNTTQLVSQFENPEARLRRFEQFLLFQGENSAVLDFWRWDRQLNPERFDEAKL